MEQSQQALEGRWLSEEEGVAKQRDTGWRPTPLSGPRRRWPGSGRRSTTALRAKGKLRGSTDVKGEKGKWWWAWGVSKREREDEGRASSR